MGIEYYALLSTALVLCTALLITIRRRRSRKALMEMTRIIRNTAELWSIVEQVPPGLISQQLRETLSVIFASYAETIGKHAADGYATTLAQRSAAVLRLPRSPSHTHSEAHSQLFRRMGNLIQQAHREGHLCDREVALARLAANLAAELGEIQGLCLSAERALSLRSVDDARAYQLQALRRCDRLPAQTAAEVRRTIEQRMPRASSA